MAFVDEVRSYKVTNKDPVFNLGVQIGGGVNIITGKPVVYLGVGLGVNLIR